MQSATMKSLVRLVWRVAGFCLLVTPLIIIPVLMTLVVYFMTEETLNTSLAEGFEIPLCMLWQGNYKKN